jgi:3-hydroxyacyl-[acyl-carrier-protein] dehydratase
VTGTVPAARTGWAAGAVTPAGAAPLRAMDGVVAEFDGEVLRMAVRVGVRAGELGGHFPGLPIYPGVFVIETLTQAMADATWRLTGGRTELRVLRSARFTAPLLDGDELSLAVRAIRRAGGGWDVTAKGTRADGTTASSIRAEFASGQACDA